MARSRIVAIVGIVGVVGTVAAGMALATSDSLQRLVLDDVGDYVKVDVNDDTLICELKYRENSVTAQAILKLPQGAIRTMWPHAEAVVYGYDEMSKRAGAEVPPDEICWAVEVAKETARTQGGKLDLYVRTTVSYDRDSSGYANRCYRDIVETVTVTLSRGVELTSREEFRLTPGPMTACR